MALTRSGMRKQVVEALTSVAPPGEQFIACLHGMTGPSPWIDGLIGGIGALIMQSFRKYYFVTLTNTSVVVNRAGRVANRPKEIVAAIPLAANPIASVNKGAVWGKLFIQFPGEAAPTKINVHRIWGADLDRFAEALAAAGAVATIPAQAAPEAAQEQAQQ
ncbi:hypothetical protein KDK95_33540 [Actinospica sp. MGRD01-02]|uniref:Uncharacterized protein n=1 Tax=Actinospica acidithermotolerans TaxID=2828514 RepID=A0A941EI79_9ACTN|nr:hypothetical protein [Actinospica acidithermotolerans]MBR7831278.1 hypothetical protein [Actinospica acidithermotolerans]